MALDSLIVSGNWPLAMSYRDGTSSAQLGRAFGGTVLPALNATLAFGSGSGQANKGYLAKRTIAAGAYDLLDLSGTLNDGLTNTLALTALKLAALAIVTPDGGATKKLRVGPQAQINPFLGAWGGVGASNYKAFTHWDLTVWEPVAGYAVTAGTGDILPVYNAGSVSLDYWIFLAGT